MVELDPLPPRIPAISIWQPYASLIVAGFQRWEHRDWPAPDKIQYKVVAIHASVRAPTQAERIELLFHMQRDGCVPGCHTLEARNLEAALNIVREGRFLPRGFFIGTAIVGRAEIIGTPGSGVKYRWPMTNSQKRMPWEAKGQQGVWMFETPEAWKEVSHACPVHGQRS